MNIENACKKFQEIFGRRHEGVAVAPGRVNLIGEHTDYNGGFVFPMAIDKQTVAAFARRDDGKINLVSASQEKRIASSVGETVAPGSEPKWGCYCLGVVPGLRDAGIKLNGIDAYFDSDVPLGAGLSSSASLEVATAMALLAACDSAEKLPRNKVALICQAAENIYAQAPCGIMDQSISAMGKTGHAMLMDCMTGETKQIPFNDPNYEILVADTQVKHSVGGSGYVGIRNLCMAAAGKLGVKLLRDISPEQLAAVQGKLTDAEFAATRHVVTETRRATDAAAALQAGDLKKFGQLMYQSHASLRDDFHVSCEELDLIVELASKCDGVLGARMTGGGFGGCAIILAAAAKANAISSAVADGFAAKFGRRCPIFASRAADGAHIVK